MAVFVASVVVAMHLAFATLDWEAVHQSTDATIEERRGTVVVVGHHLDKVVPRGQLVREVWGPSYDEDFEGLRVYVYRLRRKLERGPDPPEFLATMPSVGYMLQARPTTP